MKANAVFGAEVPANDPVPEPTAVGNPEDALVECVKRLSDMVEELKDAVDGLAGR